MSQSKPAYRDRFYNSVDGLKLHFRDYDGPLEGPPLLCLPGLTRNARDFEPVAAAFAGEHRVIAIDYRGRGLSDFDPDPSHYEPQTYAQDLIKLLDQLGIADAIFVGTSLGGLVTMLMASIEPERIASALLNDIGPELESSGLDRIREYVGKGVDYPDWKAAAAGFAEGMADIYPEWLPAQWEAFARRLLHPGGRGVHSNYDLKIADNVVAGSSSAPMDAWHLLDGLKDKPVTILRGALSDLFSERVAERMVAELPQGELVTIDNVGHAPSFDEEESIEALRRLIARTPA